VGSGLLGAIAIRDFALALFVGLVSGTYSSVFVAAPVLAVLKEREPKYRALRERIEARQSAETTRTALAPAPAPVPAAWPEPSGPEDAGVPGSVQHPPEPGLGVEARARRPRRQKRRR
jgi:preprotein translocase subunit SecF